MTEIFKQHQTIKKQQQPTEKPSTTTNDCCLNISVNRCRALIIAGLASLRLQQHAHGRQKDRKPKLLFVVGLSIVVLLMALLFVCYTRSFSTANNNKEQTTNNKQQTNKQPTSNNKHQTTNTKHCCLFVINYYFQQSDASCWDNKQQHNKQPTKNNKQTTNNQRQTIKQPTTNNQTTNKQQNNKQQTSNDKQSNN